MSEIQLYVLRHGVAGEKGPKYPDDSKRPLVAEGRKETKKAAAAMNVLGLKFDLILTSPYARALETAQITADVLGIKKKVEISPVLEPDASYQDFKAEIKRRYAKKKFKSLLIVGHEPHLSGLISRFVFGKPGAPIRLKKSGLAKLVFHEGLGFSASLNWLFTPKQLALLARS